jgi:hypothetical protein
MATPAIGSRAGNGVLLPPLSISVHGQLPQLSITIKDSAGSLASSPIVGAGPPLSFSSESSASQSPSPTPSQVQLTPLQGVRVIDLLSERGQSPGPSSLVSLSLARRFQQHHSPGSSSRAIEAFSQSRVEQNRFKVSPSSSPQLALRSQQSSPHLSPLAPPSMPTIFEKRQKPFPLARVHGIFLEKGYTISDYLFPREVGQLFLTLTCFWTTRNRILERRGDVQGKIIRSVQGHIPDISPQLRNSIFEVANMTTRLNLSNSIRMTQGDVGMLFKSFTQLTHLSLENCKLVNDKALAHIVQNTKLQVLHLTNVKKITNEGLEQLQVLVDLHSLVLSGCNISAKGLKRISCVPELQALDISYCKRRDAKGNVFTVCSGMKYILRIKNLTELNLSNCRGLGDGAIRALSNAPGKIQRLYLNGTLITDESIKYLMKFSALECVEVQKCNRLGIGTYYHPDKWRRLQRDFYSIHQHGLNLIPRPQAHEMPALEKELSELSL